MASSTEQFAEVNRRLTGVETRQFSITPTPLIYAAVGQVVMFGCLVTPGASDTDWIVSLEGQATGDEDHHNPDVEASPAYYWQYPSLASLKTGAFVAQDFSHELDAPPPADLARYDIAYIYIGPGGSGFFVAAGTPSEAVKTDYDTNGLVTTAYDSLTDAAIPVGAMPVARIYVEAALGGVAAGQIADLRDFNGRLRGAALTWNDLTTSQKNELIDPAADAATTAVLADNKAFKAQMRTMYWLGI